MTTQQDNQMKKVYIEYKTAYLLSEQDGKYTVQYTEKNGDVIQKTVSYQPIPFEEGEQLPVWIMWKGKKYRFTGTIYSWLRNGAVTLNGKYLSNTPEDDVIKELAEAKRIACDFAEVLETEAIQDALYEASKLIGPLQKEIDELNARIQQIRSEKIAPVMDKCWHDWVKIQERSTGFNSLGESFVVDWECSTCGESTTRYHTTLR